MPGSPARNSVSGRVRERATHEEAGSDQVGAGLLRPAVPTTKMCGSPRTATRFLSST